MKSLFKNKEIKRNDNVESAKMALVNTIANMISFVISMVMIPVIARVLSEDDLGIATTFLSTRNLLVTFTVFAVHSYVNKAMLEFANDKKNYLFNIVIFCMVSITGFFIISLPFKAYVMKIFSLDSFLFFWLFISMFSYAMYVLALYYTIFHNKQLLVFLMTVCTGPIAQFISLGLSFVLKEKYIGRVLGLDCAYVVVALFLIIWLIFSNYKKAINIQYIVNTLKYTIPVIPHLLSQMILTQCDLMMISYFCGEGKAGIYSMGHTVGFLAFTVMSQVMAAWSPWVFRKWESCNYDIVKRFASKILVLGAYISIGLLTVSPELIRWLLPAIYEPCIFIIPPLVVGMFFQFVYMFIYDVEYYNKKSIYIAIASVIAALTNLLLNFILIPRFGYLAAGYTTVFSYFILVICSFYFATKMKIGDRYDCKYFILTVLCVMCYAVVMMILNSMMIYRYIILIGITFIIGVKEYKSVKELIVEFRG